MAEGDLQSIVDELAERLRRSVAIDDPSIRLLAASRHFGDEDDVRIRSVLNRSIEPDISEAIFAQEIARWTTPGVVDVPDALPRLCVPVRCDGLLLGYLWLIGEEFSDDVRAAAVDAAERASTVLYRQLLLHERAKARHEAILRELVSSDTATRAQAIEDLRAEQLFADEAVNFTVLAVQSRTGDTAATPREVAFEAAVEEGVRSVPSGVALMAANRSRAWILLVQRQKPSRTLVTSVADRITAR